MSCAATISTSLIWLTNGILQPGTAVDNSQAASIALTAGFSPESSAFIVFNGFFFHSIPFLARGHHERDEDDHSGPGPNSR